MIEPGRFRTKLLSPTNLQSAKPQTSDYLQFSADLSASLDREDSAQPGDPQKLVTIILDLIRGENGAKGKVLPFRIPLGIDVFDDIKEKCNRTLQTLEEWKDVIRSTDHDE